MNPGDIVAAKYRLVRVIGQGAMGEVWAAVNQSTHGEVALKLIPDPNPDLRARLLREARACGRLKHPNIVEIYDVGTTESGEPFLVMELLSGETLADRLLREGRLPVAKAVAIASAVARALRAAHAKSIIHRDLKPANIFLYREADVEEERVKVLDFGVSKSLAGQDATTTVTGSLVGSPAYMSPEQARAGKDVDARSDLWSVGVLLFEMIAGRRPFPATSPYAAIAEILSSPIPKLSAAVPEVSPALSRVVELCITREVDARLASADELLRLLRPFGDDHRGSLDDAPRMSAMPEPPAPSLGRIVVIAQPEGDSQDGIATSVLNPVGTLGHVAKTALLPPEPAAASILGHAAKTALLPPEPAVASPLPKASAEEDEEEDSPTEVLKPKYLRPVLPSAARPQPAARGAPLDPVATVPLHAPLAVVPGIVHDDVVDDDQRRTAPMPPKLARDGVGGATATSSTTALIQTPPTPDPDRSPPPRRALPWSPRTLQAGAAVALGVVLLGVLIVRRAEPEAIAPALTANEAAAPPPATEQPEPSAPAGGDTGSAPIEAPASTASTSTAPAAARPKNSHGLIVIRSPVAAKVFLDGQAIGVTPLAPVSVLAGTHKLTFKHTMFPTRVIVVEVQPGKTSVASPNFNPYRHDPQRP